MYCTNLGTDLHTRQMSVRVDLLWEILFRQKNVEIPSSLHNVKLYKNLYGSKVV